MSTARKAKDRIGSLNHRFHFYKELQERRCLPAWNEKKIRLSTFVNLNLLGIALCIDWICTDSWKLNLIHFYSSKAWSDFLLLTSSSTICQLIHLVSSKYHFFMSLYSQHHETFFQSKDSHIF